MGKKRCPLTTYCPGKGLMKLTTQCNTCSHWLRISVSDSQKQWVSITAERSSRYKKWEYSNSKQIVNETGFCLVLAGFVFFSFVSFSFICFTEFFLIIRPKLKTMKLLRFQLDKPLILSLHVRCISLVHINWINYGAINWWITCATEAIILMQHVNNINIIGSDGKS